jgi:predicted amidohydrolase YtcJ
MTPLVLLCLAVPPADLVVVNGRIVTLDAKSTIVEALAVRDGRIVARGTSAAIKEYIGPRTQQIDARDKMILPGLYDSHAHPFGVVTTQIAAPPPVIRSLKEAFRVIAERAKTTAKGEWIVLRYVFPTRLDEARFPTRAELDAVAPAHPVLFHAGPAAMVNTAALKRSGITRHTKSPTGGMVVKDADGEPTGMIRNAYGLLRGVPREEDGAPRDKRLAGLRDLFARYNALGLTSIADRNGSSEGLRLYRQLAKDGQLTVRVNMARSFDANQTPEQAERKLKEYEAEGGPTGAGDDWVRIGPLKSFLDGGMLNGTAYMRRPWPPGPTYQITEKDYRGLLFIQPNRLRENIAVAARRKWQFTAHCAGEGAMDELLDAYEEVHRTVPLKDLRMCLTHANFPSKRNLERCRDLGVVADVQPAWLYKDGPTLAKVLGPERIRWFQPYKSWRAYTTIGGGSDHMLRYDPLDSTNPWHPWLGIWCAVTRQTERGGVLNADECLTREEALRMYTIDSAFICYEEKHKGTLEVGKLADFILVDRDVLRCKPAELRETVVLQTVVSGRVVYRKEGSE